MNVMTPPPVHIARPNAFQAEARWTLGPDALERTGGESVRAPFLARLARFVVKLMMPWAIDPIEQGGSARFPYVEIRAVRVSFQPTRFDSRRYRCELRMKDGRKVHFFSTHYESIGSFENRAATYSPFVRGLVARVAAANPACRFRSGKSRLAYWAEHIFLLAMFALLVFVLTLTGVAYLSESSWARIAIIATFMPVLFLYTRKNWPRTFKPDAIPQDVLPDPAGAHSA